MRRILLFSLSIILISCAEADVSRLMEEYLWEKRVLIVFSSSASNEKYIKQNQIIKNNSSGVVERSLVVWSITANEAIYVDGQRMPHLGTPPFYAYFKADPADFTVILLGKDGEEKLRKREELSAKELFEVIDAMPMRQREMQG